MKIPVDKAMPCKIPVYMDKERFGISHWIRRRNHPLVNEPCCPYNEIERYFSGEDSWCK